MAKKKKVEEVKEEVVVEEVKEETVVKETPNKIKSFIDFRKKLIEDLNKAKNK